MGTEIGVYCCPHYSETTERPINSSKLVRLGLLNLLDLDPGEFIRSDPALAAAQGDFAFLYVRVPTQEGDGTPPSINRLRLPPAVPLAPELFASSPVTPYRYPTLPSPPQLV